MKGNQLSNKFLDEAIEKEQPVTLSTVTGEITTRCILNYDSYTILIDDDDGLIRLIFKHAIISISW